MLEGDGAAGANSQRSAQDVGVDKQGDSRPAVSHRQQSKLPFCPRHLQPCKGLPRSLAQGGLEGEGQRCFVEVGVPIRGPWHIRSVDACPRDAPATASCLQSPA